MNYLNIESLSHCYYLILKSAFLHVKYQLCRIFFNLISLSLLEIFKFKRLKYFSVIQYYLTTFLEAIVSKSLLIVNSGMQI